MKWEATAVGELALGVAARRARGRVTRIFRNSAYLMSGTRLVLLINGGPRSPMSVNVRGSGDMREALRTGERFESGPRGLAFGDLEVCLSRAAVHRSGLKTTLRVEPVGPAALARAASSLKLLYSVSDHGQQLVESEQFRRFVNEVIVPLSKGVLGPAHSPRSFLGILGLGAGFTPAGDDFVAGFLASFNHAAASIGTSRIKLPIRVLRNRTVSESALLVDYAQNGYADEGLERLILAGLGNRPREFLRETIELAKRGHTSGLDMAEGVVFAAAAIGDLLGRTGASIEAIYALAQ